MHRSLVLRTHNLAGARGFELPSIIGLTKRCSRCGEVKLLDEFYRYSKSIDQHGAWCKNCFNKHRQHFREAHRDRERLIDHQRYLRSRDEILIRERDRNQQRKALLVAHYSSNANRCPCCGESNVRFLTIDHINGNGSKHRKSSKCGTGSVFYRWLIKEGMPEGYQVLCYNCNNARARHGICPHQLGGRR